MRLPIFAAGIRSPQSKFLVARTELLRQAGHNLTPFHGGIDVDMRRGRVWCPASFLEERRPVQDDSKVSLRGLRLRSREKEMLTVRCDVPRKRLEVARPRGRF